MEGGGNTIFVGTAPILDRKFEKDSKEHELVQKSSRDNNQNEKRTAKLTKTKKYDRRLKLKDLRIIKILLTKNYVSNNRNCTKSQLLWKDFDV